MLSVMRVDSEGLGWAQKKVTESHYLHKPVDVRCSPQAYHIMLQGEIVGCLIFGRPECPRVKGWYGRIEDVQTGICRLTNWQILNLARVWLDPCIQPGGKYYTPEYLPGYTNLEKQWRSRAASFVIDLALHRVVYDYLVHKPPVWMEQPYKIREVLSYCDTRIHQGTLYRASNFHLVRKNKQGIETYARAVRGLKKDEIAHVAECSAIDKRCQQLRLAHLSKDEIRRYWVKGA